MSSPPRASRWLVLLAGLQLILAILARLTAAGGFCPVEGAIFGCAAVQRPRVSALGPISVGDLGILGAWVALAVAGIFALRGVKRPLARDGALVLAGGAGFALGIQPLAMLAGGALCPTCLALALTSLALAVGVGRAACKHAQVDWRLLLGVGAAVGVLTVAGATWRGTELRREDAARREAALSAGGASGPQLVLVAREGCPYCRAVLADVLGDARALSLLSRTRGVELVGLDDPRAAGVPGVPVLIGFDAHGQRLGELVGYPTVPQGLAWLEQILAAAAE